MAVAKTSDRRRVENLKTKPSFGGGLVADSASESENKKLNLQGVFTLIWAWAYPCSRRWHSVASVFDLPEGDTLCSIEIRKRGSADSAAVKIGAINLPGAKGPSAISAEVSHVFEGPGLYEVRLRLDKYGAMLRIPFEIRTRDWPEFTAEEVKFASSNPDIIGTMRANVVCPKCQAAYVFEENVQSGRQLAGGVRGFPASGVFECETCPHKIYLRDIQGQIRQTLKERLAVEMRRRA